MRLGTAVRGRWAWLALCFMGCASNERVVIEAPNSEVEGWAVAEHLESGRIRVTTRQDWSMPLELDASDVRRIELLAYERFDLPLGILPDASEPGMVSKALPNPDAIFRAEFEDAESATFSPSDELSRELAAFRFGVPSACASFSLTVHELSLTSGLSALSWFPDGSALVSTGPTHYRVTRAGVQEFPRCGAASHYRSMELREDGSHVVATEGPTGLAVLRLDPVNLTCTITSSTALPGSHHLTIAENLSGDPSAPVFALASTGAVYRLRNDEQWELAYPAGAPPPDFDRDRLQLLQIRPGVLVGSIDAPLLLTWSEAIGARSHPLPEPPALVATTRAEALTYGPSFGLVVSINWTPIYRMDPDEPNFDEIFYDFKDQAKRMRPFRNGFMAFLKEGPAVQFPADEICLPGTTISGGSLLNVAASDHAIVGSYREDPKRFARWLHPE